MKYNLSEITDLIKDRRTIYPEQFSDRKIQKDQITNILNNALWAPTHGNTQPWRFVVFTEDSRQDLSTILGKIYLDIIPKENQNDLKLSRMMARPLKSSVVVAVIMNRDETRRISELDEIGAVASAIQNMHLTCTAYGIGGFWATPKVIFTPQMNEFLKIGADDKCLGLFFMGYPAVEWPKGQRRPLEYVTEWR
ncbi:MAG: nitroreductase [Crocinitomicaceae bacterium]|nr:nitroreductase [Crocinitomicaceae bacterium]